MPGMYSRTICVHTPSAHREHRLFPEQTKGYLSVRRAYCTAARVIAQWQLAARVLKGIETEQRAAEVLRQQEEAARELVWARSCREILLMRHPTNWAGASLLQVLPPS